ncbi:MAG: hypothetical protein QNJ46_21280 [Leptolyngbyaceae cyanobacterium MO_188.B28]|nr:hypothetical protein [Leptolyngbyaceae cyanobacterium MO_188.B28]
MFFPHYCASHRPSRQDYQQYRLKRLKAFRDSLETCLAAINAAIEIVERQTSESEGSEAA